MTRPTDPLFDQRIADWLEDDPHDAPGQVLEVVLAALPSIPRRRATPAPWRHSTMNRPARLAAAAVIGVLAIGGALYLTRPDQPAIGGPSPTPGVSASPVESAIPSPSARAASWTATGSMARTRVGATGVPLLDGEVLVVGGNGPGWPLGPELYDPKLGRWTATGPMITPRLQFTATRLLDGRVLVANGAGDSGALASAEIFDPSTGSWTATGDMGTARYNATATLLPDGKVLVAGGDIVTHFYNPSVASAELYDPDTGSWTPTGSMETARSGHAATLLPDGKVLITGGSNDNDTLSYSLASAELYDPATGTWTPAHAMTTVRSWHTATLLGDGGVLVVGGESEATSVSAELYDPTTDAWTAAGSLSAPFFGFTATLLLDGSVLVAGGGGPNGGAPELPASGAAELFDAGTRTWGATVAMLQGRASHTATLLPDGTVLVAGGVSGWVNAPNGPGPLGVLASAELFDPGTGR